MATVQELAEQVEALRRRVDALAEGLRLAVEAAGYSVAPSEPPRPVLKVVR